MLLKIFHFSSACAPSLAVPSATFPTARPHILQYVDSEKEPLGPTSVQHVLIRAMNRTRHQYYYFFVCLSNRSSWFLLVLWNDSAKKEKKKYEDIYKREFLCVKVSFGWETWVFFFSKWYCANYFEIQACQVPVKHIIIVFSKTPQYKDVIAFANFHKEFSDP